MGLYQNIQRKLYIIRVINYFPLQLWRKKCALDALLKEARLNEPNLRTLIRMGGKDIKLMTKYVGELYYREKPINAYGDME